MAKKENKPNISKGQNKSSKIGGSVNKSLPDFRYTPKPPKKKNDGRK
ncbi:hypothetical protein [Tenacibaculum maritimum]|nr:hypothetical protein [Tenacibaculum maritimum]